MSTMHVHHIHRPRTSTIHIGHAHRPFTSTIHIDHAQRPCTATMHIATMHVSTMVWQVRLEESIHVHAVPPCVQMEQLGGMHTHVYVFVHAYDVHMHVALHVCRRVSKRSG